MYYTGESKCSRHVAETIDYLLNQAGRHPLLTAQQEIELGRQIRTWQDWEGGPDQAPPLVQRRGRRALDKFLTCNLRLAHFIARRYTNRGVALEDLFQAAAEGLLAAYKRFDPTKGYRSSSYACWWGQQACQVIVAQQGNGLRLPTTVSEQLRKITHVTNVLSVRLGREPTNEEIEEAAGLSSGRLLELREGGRRASVLSLDAQFKDSGLGGSDGASLLDYAAADNNPQKALENEELQRLIRELVETSSALTPQQRILIQCRYLGDHSSDNPPSIARLASQLNMNRETLRRMEKTALSILRSLLPAGIADYPVTLSNS
ncbi:MAG: sigma-70 family RNA polymerase sigma factor [Cyanobium sp. 49614_E6]|nr:sigma-70 family RNA polymerase sigma factor [Cyanobium sp. 49614_E6]MCE2838730.1 sigma-70 family RNA polymerase sigma factor [Cyanobium sp. 49614_E6]